MEDTRAVVLPGNGGWPNKEPTRSLVIAILKENNPRPSSRAFETTSSFLRTQVLTYVRLSPLLPPPFFPLEPSVLFSFPFPSHLLACKITFHRSKITAAYGLISRHQRKRIPWNETRSAFEPTPDSNEARTIKA